MKKVCRAYFGCFSCICGINVFQTWNCGGFKIPFVTLGTKRCKTGACPLKMWLTTTGVVSKPDIFGQSGNLRNSSDALSIKLRRPKILKIISINVFMVFVLGILMLLSKVTPKKKKQKQNRPVYFVQHPNYANFHHKNSFWK